MAYQNRAARETIEGVIEAVGRGGKGIKIGDDWYGAFAAKQTNGAKQGDEVKFEFEVSDKGGQTFRNIKGDVQILSRGEAPAQQSSSSGGGRAAPQQRAGGNYVAKEFPISPTHPDRAIIRQNAATRAVELIVAAGVSEEALSDAADFAIELARKFEAYYAGEGE